MTVGGTVKKTPVAILAASLLLAACGGGAKQADASSTSTSPSTSTSAPTVSDSPITATPKADPNIPAAARAHTPAGAAAFVKYFLERLNVAWTVPRAGILSPLCQASSKACAAYEKTAARLASTAHHYDGNPLTVGFIGPLGYASASHINVLANVVQERRSEVDAAGKTYVTDQRKDLRLDFELLQTGQAWSVASIKIMK